MAVVQWDAGALAFPLKSNTCYWDVFVAAGAGEIAKVYRISMYTSTAMIATGTLSSVLLSRSSAAQTYTSAVWAASTTGPVMTRIYPVPRATYKNYPFPSTIEVWTGRTVTVVAPPFRRMLFRQADPTWSNTASAGMYYIHLPFVELWEAGAIASVVQPLTCRAGEGLVVGDTAAGTLNAYGASIEVDMTTE